MSRVVSDPRGVDPRSVDLDVSRFSQGSTASSVTLGGESYPIGSTVGTSGLFVIGDPNFDAPRETSSTRSSQITLNQATGSSNYLISERYDFEEWNWPVIRFSCLGLLLALMIGLLAAVVALAIEGQSACHLDLDWYQGSVIYHINVTKFYDADRNSYGDIKGIQDRLDYIEYLGVGVLCLNSFLPTIQPGFEEVTSFKSVDKRVGTKDDMRNLANALHRRDMKLMLEFEPVWTSDVHDWFQESRRQSSTTGNEFKDVYVWTSTRPGNSPWMWTMDILRNQYFMHLNNSERPILNWNNLRVAKLFELEMKDWAELGVDGFYIRGMDRFYMTGDYSYEAMDSYLESWSRGLNVETTPNGARVLMLESSYLTQVARNKPTILPTMMRNIKLVDVRLDIYPTNLSASIVAQADAALTLWQSSPNTWTSFHIGKFSTLIDDGLLPALQTLIMILPGTPALMAGQEVGEDPYDTSYKGTRVKLMEWSRPGSGQLIKPFKKGSILDVTNIDIIKSVIDLRTSKPTLRADEDGKNHGDKLKHLGVTFVDSNSDSDILFVKRYFYKRDTFFYVVNFGKSVYVGDWTSQTSIGFFLIETTGQDNVQDMKINELETKPEQGILFYIPI